MACLKFYKFYSILKIIGLLLVGIFLILGFSINVKAETVNDSFEQTYILISADGEICSATVHCDVTQDCKRGGSSTVYGYRTGCTWMTVNATLAMPSLSATDPAFTDANASKIRSFSPWVNETVYLPGGARCAYSKSNSSSVNMPSPNGYFIHHGFTVGGNDFAAPGYYSGAARAKI